MILIIPNSLSDKIEVGKADHIVAPSWLSPFTSMSVRYAIDKYEATEVRAFRVKDAMAAISARSIAKAKPRITFVALPNSRPPKGIPADVKAGVDAWIFPSERLKKLYPADLKHTSVEPPIASSFSGTAIFDESAKNYAWIGDIDGNTMRLKKAIEWVNAKEEECTLSVFGTGKPGNVMPAVKLARSIENSDRITWMGQPFTPEHCNTPITAIIQTGLDPTPLENKIHSQGIPLINIHQQ